MKPLTNRFFHLFLYLILTGSCAFVFGPPKNLALMLTGCITFAATLIALLLGPGPYTKEHKQFEAAVVVSVLAVVFATTCFWARDDLSFVACLPYLVMIGCGSFFPFWLRYRGRWNEKPQQQRPYRHEGRQRGY